MKIFNWVQKRFNPNNTLKDELGRSVKKPESETKVSQALLEKTVALTDVIGGWKDGIFTIGTFGYDPLKPFKGDDLLFLDMSYGQTLEDQEEDEEEDELGQLPHYPLSEEDQNVEDDGDHLYQTLPLLANPNQNSNLDFGNADDDKSTPVTANDVGSLGDHGFEDEKKKKGGERVTLADLFSADSDIVKPRKPHSCRAAAITDDDGDSTKKPVAPKDKTKARSLAKKLIPLIGSKDSRPATKIHLLMKKMLKRKIHPELGSKVSGDKDEMKTMTEKAAAAEQMQLPHPIHAAAAATTTTTNNSNSIIINDCTGDEYLSLLPPRRQGANL